MRSQATLYLEREDPGDKCSDIESVIINHAFILRSSGMIFYAFTGITVPCSKMRDPGNKVGVANGVIWFFTGRD